MLRPKEYSSEEKESYNTYYSEIQHFIAEVNMRQQVEQNDQAQISNIENENLDPFKTEGEKSKDEIPPHADEPVNILTDLEP